MASSHPGTCFDAPSGVDSNVTVVLRDISGLVTFGRFTGSTPVTANEYQKGCILEKTDATPGQTTTYENIGTVASPNFATVSSGGVGITELNTDVLAGPGVGNQTATVVGFDTVPLSGPAVVDASFYVYDTAQFNPVIMSGDATMDNAGAVTVTGINGAGLGTTTATPGNILVADAGSLWQSVTVTKDATMSDAGLLTVVGLQGYTVLASVPPTGGALCFDGTFWGGNKVPMLIATGIGFDFNSAADQTLTMVGIGSTFVITDVVIKNASTNLTTADTFAIWSGASQTGSQYAGLATGSIAKLTTNTKFISLAQEQGAGVTGAAFFNEAAGTSLIASVLVLQGAPATADVLVFGYVLA